MAKQQLIGVSMITMMERVGDLENVDSQQSRSRINTTLSISLFQKKKLKGLFSLEKRLGNFRFSFENQNIIKGLVLKIKCIRFLLRFK